MARRTAYIVPLIGASFVTGCGPAPPPSGISQVSGLLPTFVAGSDVRRLLSSDNGLEMREWVIMDRESRISAAMAELGQNAFVDTKANTPFRRNGLRLVKFRQSDLQSLLASLGGASVDATTWHGQVHQWRELAAYSISPAGIAVAVDGRVRRFESGTFRLLMRSWTVAMEDGPRLLLQLVGQFDRPEQESFRRFLADRSVSGEVFHSLALEMPLEAGFGYALLYASPEIDWSFGAANQEDSTPKPVAAELVGPANEPEQVGPTGAPPATFGELLFRTETHPAKRRVLVFVPKFSPEMFPPGTVGAGTFEDGP